MTGDLALLAIDAATLFHLDPHGRIERQGDPDGGVGPRFWLASCQGGALARFRADVEEARVAAISKLVATEPAFAGEARAPVRLERYLDLLAPVERWSFGPIFLLPHAPAFAHDARLVRSGTSAGEALVRAFARGGMPAGLRDLGFADVADLWEPWCFALQDGEPAAICFAARLSEGGAEAGVATAPAYRGRGLAAAATAGWAAHPDLAARTLFYSTWDANLASQKVAARLRLRLIAASFQVA